MVQLAHLANRSPSQLSGGQETAYCLARALAHTRSTVTKWTLAPIRTQSPQELRRWLRGLHEEFRVSTKCGSSPTIKKRRWELSESRLWWWVNGTLERRSIKPVRLYASTEQRFVFDFLASQMFLKADENGKWHKSSQVRTLFCLTLSGNKSVGQNSRLKKSGPAVHSAPQWNFSFQKSQQLRRTCPLRVIGYYRIGRRIRPWANNQLIWQQKQRIREIEFTSKSLRQELASKKAKPFMSHPKAGYFFAEDAKKTGC